MELEFSEVDIGRYGILFVWEIKIIFVDIVEL